MAHKIDEVVEVVKGDVQVKVVRFKVQGVADGGSCIQLVIGINANTYHLDCKEIL